MDTDTEDLIKDALEKVEDALKEVESRIRQDWLYNKGYYKGVRAKLEKVRNELEEVLDSET